MKYLFFAFVFICTANIQATEFKVPSHIYVPPYIKKECIPIYSKYKEGDIEYVMNFERDTNNPLLESCKEGIDYYPKESHYFYTCNTLNSAVYYGKIEEVKKFEHASDRKQQETCMRFSLKQVDANYTDAQLFTFTYVIQRLIHMKQTIRQEVLNETLHDASSILASDHRFTKRLLALGADPTQPSKTGTSALSASLWMTNDGGSCKTVRALTDAMKPEEFSIQYPNGVEGQKDISITPLMEAINMTTFCSDEVIIMASKATHLDQQDANGDTALHHIYRYIINLGAYEHYFEMQKILRDKGASMDIQNAQGITPMQLLLQLKSTPEKCGDYGRPFCERL